MCDDGVGVTGAVDFGDVADIKENDILRKVFRSEDDAYEFYKKLGKLYGFGIRRGDMFKDEKGNLVRRRFFCNREGQRDKKHYNRIDRKRPYKPETRTNCEVRMCIYLDKESLLWRVKKIILNHNHDMTHPGMVHLISNFCSMTDAAKAQIDGFQGCGISTAKTMRYMAGVSRGYSLVGFLKKDAYNYVDKRRRAKIAQAATDYGLQDVLWWNQVYGKKEMWANAFLCEKFCTGDRTTSRCEGINSVCKNFLESKHSILELVQNLELLVWEYMNNELLAQFRSIYSEPVLTTSLDSLERHAASLYTRAVFGDVKREIEIVSSVNFVGVRRSLTTKVYIVDEYGHPARHIIVLCDKNMGVSCKHIFFVMKHELLLTIPSSLVLKRWTNEAKSLKAYVEKTDDRGDRGFLLCHGALHLALRWLFFLGAQQVRLFAVALERFR
ncbi:hypothetical protein Ahy_A02g008544 [Arachis hypogaea]|uniref:FAR1 domain-containing protein n=1 Tax=Arachis hypogaea TaxID=3818 RepID=A0A445EEK9_ARAHY|nr:hypothetical protein Ahy_A02g008544 [Arachis hypogaea]